MSLAPSEQHILAEIETRLRRSDPKLAARPSTRPNARPSRRAPRRPAA